MREIISSTIREMHDEIRIRKFHEIVKYVFEQAVDLGFYVNAPQSDLIEQAVLSGFIDDEAMAVLKDKFWTYQRQQVDFLLVTFLVHKELMYISADCDAKAHFSAWTSIGISAMRCISESLQESEHRLLSMLTSHPLSLQSASSE